MSLEWEGTRLLSEKITICTGLSDNFIWVKILAFCTDNLK